MDDEVLQTTHDLEEESERANDRALLYHAEQNQAKAEAALEAAKKTVADNFAGHESGQLMAAIEGLQKQLEVSRELLKSAKGAGRDAV
jgi:hypothetical protein